MVQSEAFNSHDSIPFLLTKDLNVGDSFFHLFSKPECSEFSVCFFLVEFLYHLSMIHCQRRAFILVIGLCAGYTD